MLVSVKVQKWPIKMMHLHEDDHIKDVQSTCRGSCNTRMECWWLGTSSTLGSFWYSTSLSALCTQWGQNKVFLSSPSFLLCSSGPDRHVPKTKATPFTGSRLLPVWSQQFVSAAAISLSVRPFFHQHCVCVFLVCFTVLFLCISPQ